MDEDLGHDLARDQAEASAKPPGLTPEGLAVVERDDDEERIVVRYHDGKLVALRNVASATEDRDRYEVRVNGERYTDQLLAPQSPGPSWSADPLGSAADAGASFASEAGWLANDSGRERDDVALEQDDDLEPDFDDDGHGLGLG